MLVPRLDLGEIKSYQRTPEGFLNIYMSVSKVGSLTYQRFDGSLENEYLSEEELFNETSLATLVGKPVTLDHPPEWLSSNNIRKYIRGAVSHKVIKDSPFLTVLATVYDSETIQAIESGKARQISAGYRAETIRDSSGKIHQKNRQYNHISVVPLGRAGSDVRVHFDAIQNINQGRDMAVQVANHSDELADLIAAECGARDRYVARMRRDSSRSVSDPAQSGKGSQQVVIPAGNSDADPLPDDGRKAYLERLKNPKR